MIILIMTFTSLPGVHWQLMMAVHKAVSMKALDVVDSRILNHPAKE